MEINEKLSAKDRCMNYLLRIIFQSNMKPGDKLPASDKLCKLIGVSLTTLREAMRALEAQGIVKMRNGVGCFIENPNGENQISSNIIIQNTDLQRKLIEITEVRKSLERQMIECIIMQSTEEELEMVQFYLDQLLFIQHKGNNTSPADRLFHEKIREICHNGILRSFVQSANDLFLELCDSAECSSSGKLAALFTDTVVMHSQMYTYVRAKDLKSALASNDKMLELVLSRLISNVIST